MVVAVADGHHARVQASYPVNCRFGDFELELEVGLLLPAVFELVQLGCGWVGVVFTRDDRIRFQGFAGCSDITVHVGFILAIMSCEPVIEWSAVQELRSHQGTYSGPSELSCYLCRCS